MDSSIDTFGLYLFRFYTSGIDTSIDALGIFAKPGYHPSRNGR
jgi:hypothetical protein